MDDRYVRAAVATFAQVTTALVGIGAVEPSKLLAASGNVFAQAEIDLLRERGAVGDILLHFFNKEGKAVLSPLNDRVISMPLDQLARVDRSVGVAGGARKRQAILGALRRPGLEARTADLRTTHLRHKGIEADMSFRCGRSR